MGCDGGSIPRREEMVKLKKKQQKAEKDVELMAKWRHCALSGEELRFPIVACDLGRMYNKEALLLALLDKANIPELVKHIRSLKDIVELNLTPNPGYKPSDKADVYNDVQAAKYVCPTSNLEMSGRYRFAFLRGCGCVFAEKALKEVPDETCAKCGKPFTPDDITILYGTDEDVQRQTERMEQRRQQDKMAKRKRQATVAPTVDLPPETSSGPSTELGSEPAKSKPKHAGGNKQQSKLSSKAAASQLAANAKQSASSSSVLNTASVVSHVALKATEELKYKTVADDPGARDAYKSLFLSGAKDEPKNKAHWVTYFPYH